MSETVSANAGQEPPHNKPPGFEEAQQTGPIPSAYDVALDEINPIAPRLFSEHRWHEYFERLRKEDPVHFNETESAGRYWSLTRYDDIKVLVPYPLFRVARNIAIFRFWHQGKRPFPSC